MKCPKCGGKVSVIDSRTTDQNYVRRTRACYHCGNVFITFELPAKDFGQKFKGFNG